MPLTRGPITAKVMILGEAPGANEISAGRPFVGASGKELSKMLEEAGISESDCFITNVCHERPPSNRIEVWMPTSKKEAARLGCSWKNGKYISTEIERGLATLNETIAAMPNLKLIIALGNVPLWAMTGNWGITKWRGSQIPGKPAVVPTIHPAAIMRQWSWRWIAVQDLKRAKEWLAEGLEVPPYEFTIRPSFTSVCGYLERCFSNIAAGSTRLSVDLETRSRHIACIGLADSSLRAICIPFMTLDGPYWTEQEEIHIVGLLYRILTTADVIGQNYLYDRQYIARRWGFRSRLTHDTMVKHHLCFPGVSKGLDFISSLYNKYHLYWKDESKDWDPKLGEEQLWIYNCKDACATFEANDHLSQTITEFGLDEQLAFQMRTAEIAFDMMLRGVLVNRDYKMELHEKLTHMMQDCLSFIHKVSGVELNPSSPKQVSSLCYDVLKLPPKYKIDKRTGRRLTSDKDAIAEWIESCEPLFRPLLQAIADYRSLQVFNSTFALAPLDPDGRFRCSINVAGPETFRWSTSEDAFGYGTNMQNIPHLED